MKHAARKPISTRSTPRYRGMVDDLSRILERSRGASARAVNAILTVTCWEVGRSIVEFEQAGRNRAEYGEELLKRLAADLSRRVGRGFGWRSLYDMRRFYELYRSVGTKAAGAVHAPEARLPRTGFNGPPEILQAVSAKSGLLGIARRFQLPWSHYARLLRVEDPRARSFYEQEALRGGWSLRQLDRQVSSASYERSALSRTSPRGRSSSRSTRSRVERSMEPDIRDPYVLEFLGLKDEYSESDLEDALITHLQQFLVELGGDFAFVGRQWRLRIGGTWYRVDLVFFQRTLRCLVVIDLKVGPFDHADAGQMHMYLNYAREHWMRRGENPPIGLILSSEANSAVAHYALAGLPNQVLTAKYQMKLPNARRLARELRRAREEHASSTGPTPAESIQVSSRGRRGFLEDVP